MNTRIELVSELIQAIQTDDVETVEHLIRDGVDVNGCVQTDGNQLDLPINMACSRAAETGDLRIPKLLVEHGAIIGKTEDADELNEVGTIPPLAAACHTGGKAMPKVCWWLIQQGCDVNLETSDTSAMMSICNHPESADGRVIRTVQMLLKAGVTVDTINASSAINDATLHGNIPVVQLLLEHGADVNHIQWSDTPLIQAVTSENIGMVQLLLEHGADITISPKGVSPIDIASNSMLSKNNDILKLLQDAATLDTVLNMNSRLPTSTPVRAPRVADDPVGGAVLLAPADHADGVPAEVAAGGVLVDAAGVGLEVGVDVVGNLDGAVANFGCTICRYLTWVVST